MSLLYSQAAQALAPCLSGKTATNSSLKSRALKSDNQPATLALASQTLRFKSTLDLVLTGAKVDVAQLVSNEALGYILIYELLFGHGSIRGGGGAKRAVSKYESALRESLSKLKVIVSSTRTF